MQPIYHFRRCFHLITDVFRCDVQRTAELPAWLCVDSSSGTFPARAGAPGAPDKEERAELRYEQSRRKSAFLGGEKGPLTPGPRGSQGRSAENGFALLSPPTSYQRKEKQARARALAKPEPRFAL